jgi:hypothetical protein
LREPTLEAILRDFAVTRESLEARDRHASDSAPPEGLKGAIIVAYAGLVVHLSGSAGTDELTFGARLEPLAQPPSGRISAVSPASFGMADAAFKEAAINLLLVGFSAKSLSLVKNRDVYREMAESGERYVYAFDPPIDVFTVQSMSADALLRLFLADILEALERPDSYASRGSFDHNVYCKFLALLSALDSCGGGFDAGPDGGQEHTAPVPTAPSGPHLTGEAEEPLPEPEAADLWVRGP